MTYERNEFPRYNTSSKLKVRSNEHFLITYVSYVTYYPRVLSEVKVHSIPISYSLPSYFFIPNQKKKSTLHSKNVGNCFYAKQIIGWLTLTMFNSLQIWQSAAYAIIVSLVCHRYSKAKSKNCHWTIHWQNPPMCNSWRITLPKPSRFWTLHTISIVNTQGNVH